MQDSWHRLTSDSTPWQNTLKNSHNLQNQWLVVSTLCQEMKIHLNRKVGYEGTLRLNPYWKSQPATYNVNMEWKLDMNLWTDNSHSWVRISHCLNKFVMDISNNREDNNNNEQETSEIQFEDFALKTNVLAFASRSKAQAKPRRRTPASSSTRTVPIGERKWTDVEPEDYSPIAYPVSKQLSTLLYHGDLLREDDGAIKFCIKDYLRNDFGQSQHWSDEMWKSTMAKRRRQQEKISILYWSIRRNSSPPSSSRSFRTQSYWSFITRQCDNSEQLLPVHLSRWMCNQFTFHHQFRIDTGRTKFEQKTDGILHVCWSYGQKSQGSSCDRLECTASCTIPA